MLLMVDGYRLTVNGKQQKPKTAHRKPKTERTEGGAVWFSALAWGARGRQFESGPSDQNHRLHRMQCNSNAYRLHR